jgi:hypothetical protein
VTAKRSDFRTEPMPGSRPLDYARHLTAAEVANVHEGQSVLPRRRHIRGSGSHMLQRGGLREEGGREAVGSLVDR